MYNRELQVLRVNDNPAVADRDVVAELYFRRMLPRLRDFNDRRENAFGATQFGAARVADRTATIYASCSCAMSVGRLNEGVGM